MNQVPFGFTPGDDGNQPFDLNSLGDMLSQLGAAMKRSGVDGGEAVSWSTIRDVARQAIAAESDPSIVEAQRTAVENAVSLAQTWLDPNTSFPASSLKAHAWSRSEWVENTLAAWQPVINPIAEGMTNTVTSLSADAAESLPEEMKSMLGPMMNMAKQMSAVTTSMQMGNGLAALSADLLAGGEIGLPLSADNIPAVFPNHVTTFAAENELPAADVLMFVAAREAAVQRLFAANPWLKADLIDLVAGYARGLTFDRERISEAMGSIDPSRPESMQEIMASGVFTPAATPEQQRQLERLEFRVALIEGWVAAVVAASLDSRLGSVAALSETMNRRRASGGPAERAFANLVGLELRPRLMRQATAFWQSVAELVGSAARDEMWRHPDFLPSVDDLEDPAGFVKNTSAE